MTGTVKLPEGTEMVMPGDNLKFEVELIAPIAMEESCGYRDARPPQKGGLFVLSA